MERRLFDAAREGSVTSLLNLLKEDPIILDRISTSGTYSETPLHIAVILGNFDFVKELLQRKPTLATEIDLHKSTPLHLASATNNVKLVTLLLSVSPGIVCRARDAYGRCPVHVAAIKGRVEVLKELMRVDSGAALLRTDQDDSILHLCVKFNQFEALKVLIERINDNVLLNCGDCDGNTILHLSVLNQQSEAVNYLLQIQTIEVNAKNGAGQTAMDILFKGVGGMIGRTLHNAGAVITNSNSLPSPSLPENNGGMRKNFLLKYLQDKQEAVMVAASLIAAAAFQAGVNPPGGIYQETINDDKQQVMDKHKAGTSIMAYSAPGLYTLFIVENTVGFIAALSVFLLLLTGLPQKHRFFKGLFMVSIWMAIVAIAASYVSSIITLAPPDEQVKVVAFSIAVLVIAVLLWILIVLWYGGFGPRIVGIIHQRRASKNGPMTRAGSLLGGATTGGTGSV
ncbi:ankyrin repeat-containing protein BDA1-like [Chenopodium quinoa]|uniref:PGG domain-containing protein n=1 Tax=Chenopodium quinoa TaxID=63459 RepID=A0A803LAK2_CHEQI|nr:ankyrin repeat-containing protein BDA1-like [Chenopodium quinoa]